MKKFPLHLMLTLAALALGLFAVLYQRKSVVLTGGDGSPFVSNVGGPNIRYGDTYRGGYGTAGLPSTVGGSACGCGGSLSTQPAAVPAYDLLSRMQQDRLPYGARPMPVNDYRAAIPLLTNGASV